MEAVLGGGGLLSGFTSSRPWTGTRPPTRRRLEPLPEDEEETSSSTSTPDISETTNSCLIDQVTPFVYIFIKLIK